MKRKSSVTADMNAPIATELNGGSLTRLVMLCVEHKLEVWKRGYGGAEAIAAAIPIAYKKSKCSICNGTWSVNHQLSQIEHNEKVSHGGAGVNK